MADKPTETETPRPLDGVRVLDAATFIAAPFTASIMGEFGAEVIKIEQPGAGDPLRHFGTKTERADSTLCWLSEGRNKQSVTLDLRKPEGAEVFRRLVAKSDVLCENFRPGTLERWGLGWEDLRKVNPALVMLRVSGYGQTGPYRDRPGFARVAHAVGGLSALAGMPGETPVTPGSTSLADYMSGLYGTIGVMMALRHRDRTGEGQYIDVALYESVFRVLDELAPAYARTGKVRDREGAGTANACPHGHFRARDGKWLAIACTSDKMFERLAQAMGRSELAAPESYGYQARRLAGRAEVDALVGAWTGSMSRDDVVERCLAFEVPCGPLNTVADIFADPHFKARGNLLGMDDAELGRIVIPNAIPTLSATPGRVDSLGPSLGASTDEVLENVLGYSKDRIAALRRAGIV